MKSFGKVWNWSTVRILSTNKMPQHGDHTSFRKVVITRIERLSMKVTSDSESIAREACDSLRSKSDSRWKPRWDEMGATARDGVHRCRTHGLALPPNWADVCKLHNDLKCSTPTCVELLTYVVNLVWCATHFGRCVDLRIMCHTSPFGECAAVRISSLTACRNINSFF